MNDKDTISVRLDAELMKFITDESMSLYGELNVSMLVRRIIRKAMNKKEEECTQENS